ncbi:MAG: hypothetical protein V9E83_12715 [Baekduia sp.]
MKIEVQGTASPAEAAAIAAAIARFRNDHAPVIAAAAPRMSPWLRAGLLEATGREPDGSAPW